MRIFKNPYLLILSSFALLVVPTSPIRASDQALIIESSDLCPLDPLKNNPGVCGCGVSDADANSNGVTDCLATPDTASTIASLIGKITRVKVLTGDPAKDKPIKQQRADLKNSIRRVVKGIKKNQAAITVRNGQDITRLISQTQNKVDTVLAADSTQLKPAKKAALRAIVTTLNALFVPLP